MARTVGSVGSETALQVRLAALALFARYGYAAVSMRQIASEVGLQASALYNHFPAKQDILVDLLETHMRDLLSAWENESREFSDPVSALSGFVRFHIGFHLERQDEVFISNMELRNLEADNFARIENLRRLYEGYVRKILVRGQAKGDFQIADVPVTAMAIIAMLTGVNTWFRTSGRLAVDDIEQIYVNMVLAIVGTTSNNKPAGTPVAFGER